MRDLAELRFDAATGEPTALAWRGREYTVEPGSAVTLEGLTAHLTHPPAISGWRVIANAAEEPKLAYTLALHRTSAGWVIAGVSSARCSAAA